METLNLLSEDQLKEFNEKLQKQISTEDIETCIRNEYPSLYVAILKETGRNEDLKALYDGTISAENYTWYILIEIEPKINKLRAEGRLKVGKIDDI